MVILPKHAGRKMPDNSDKLIADAIEHGYSLKEIGRNVGGVSRQRVLEYLKHAGLHMLWKEKRHEVMLHNQARSGSVNFGMNEVVNPLVVMRESFVSMLACGLEQKVGEMEVEVKSGVGGVGEKAVSKAVRYWFPKRKAPLLKPLDVYVRMLEMYYSGLEKGEKYSVMQLAKKGGLCFPYVGVFLKKVGEKPMYRTFSRRVTTVSEKEAIQRGAELQLSYTDIAYFLGLKDYVVRTNPRWKQYGVACEEQLSFSCVGSKEYIVKKASLRDVSQMYEATDAGFCVEEVVELLQVGKIHFYREGQISFFLQQREKIEPKLIGVLRLLYNNPSQETPYR